MKTLVLYCCIALLCSCQKEYSFETNGRSAGTQQPSKELNADASPQQTIKDTLPPSVDLDSFTRMLREDVQYKVVRHYSSEKDLWSSVPAWIQDDAYTFRQTGNGWIDANVVQDPAAPFFGREQSWKAFKDSSAVRLEWIDLRYEPMIFTVESFVDNTSFTVSWTASDTKLFTEYHIWQ